MSNDTNHVNAPLITIFSIGNEQEHFRGGSLASQIYSSDIDDKTAHEVYLWPFGEAVKAGVGSVMCSYNKVNQTQSCQNSKILNGMLKEELGFQGFVTSDWAAAINGVQPALAGMDMDMPGFFAYGLGNQNETDPDDTVNSFWGSALIQAVNNGSVPESRVDDMATRILASWYKMGQDQNYPAVNFDQLTEDTFLNGNLVNEHVKWVSSTFSILKGHSNLTYAASKATTINLSEKLEERVPSYSKTQTKRCHSMHRKSSVLLSSDPMQP